MYIKINTIDKDLFNHMVAGCCRKVHFLIFVHMSNLTVIFDELIELSTYYILISYRRCDCFWIEYFLCLLLDGASLSDS